MAGVEWVFHAATLHQPHIDSHSRQDFIDINVSGTLNLLEESVAAGVGAFVFTSTTSVFGDALVPPAGMPSAWITEDVAPIPRNIYGVTKAAAETLCQLFHRNERLPCIVLRVSRFFPEEDLDEAVRAAYPSDNMKVNEYLYRRVDLEDAAGACLLAAERAQVIGFGRYIVSATTPFTRAISSSCAAMRHWSCGAVFPISRKNMRGAAGRWSQASTASTSTSAHAKSLAGSPATISTS